MFQNRQNKEIPEYHVLIRNFIRLQAFTFMQTQIFKFFFSKKIKKISLCNLLSFFLLSIFMILLLPLTPFLTNVPLLYPMETSENLSGFLFSVRIEVEHSWKMG